jgi:hypothetical protein
MKMLFALTAAALMATALSIPASAGTVGCDQGNTMSSSAATNCHNWRPANAAVNQPTARAAFAYAPSSHTIVTPSTEYFPDNGEGTGISGGSA